MKNLIYLTFILFSLGCHAQTEAGFPKKIQTNRTAELKRILGTKVYIKVPAGYQYIKELARYQKNEHLYIQVVESNTANFIKVRPGFTTQAIEAKGAKIDVLEDIKLNQFDGIYGDGPSKYPGRTKLMLVFGDENFAVMIGGVCETADAEGKKELQDILKSIYYDADLKIDNMELANFYLDTAITNFKYAGTASNIFMYNLSGRPAEPTTVENSFQVAAFPKMSDEKALNFANDLLWRYERKGFTLSNKTNVKTTINNYSAYVLVTNITLNNKKGIMYQAFLTGDNSCLFFMGTAYDGTENYLDKFKRTVLSIKIK